MFRPIKLAKPKKRYWSSDNKFSKTSTVLTVYLYLVVLAFLVLQQSTTDKSHFYRI